MGCLRGWDVRKIAWGLWGKVVEWSAPWTFQSEHWWFEAQSLSSCCSIHCVSPPRCIKWVPVTLQWTSSIPSRGEKQYSQLLHATETGISSSRVGLLADVRLNLFTYNTHHIRTKQTFGSYITKGCYIFAFLGSYWTKVLIVLSGNFRCSLRIRKLI